MQRDGRVFVSIFRRQTGKSEVKVTYVTSREGVEKGGDAVVSGGHKDDHFMPEVVTAV